MNTEAGRGKMPLRSRSSRPRQNRRQFVDTLVRFLAGRISQALRHA